MYQHPQHARTPDDEAFDKMPCIQIDGNLWAVMRERRDRPVAMIMGLIGANGVRRFLVMTWDPVPAKRRVISEHGTLKDANMSVRWDVSQHVTGRENARDGNAP